MLENILAWLMELQPRVEQAYLKAISGDETVDNRPFEAEEISEQTENLDPMGVNSEPHILTTNQLNPVTCNRLETEQAATGVGNSWGCSIKLKETH